MKAAVYSGYGPPEVVQIKEVQPNPKDDEVLVRVRASTVCAADWRLRRPHPFLGRLFNGLWRPKKIRVLGMEFSGTVESVGKSVTWFAVGDRVFGSPMLKFGAHADYVCLPQTSLLAPQPANTTLEESAAFAFGGLTVLSFLKRAAIQPGQRVLIYGASGSVGVFAVQLAKHFGAHVTAVCSTANVGMVRTLGADEVVDYTKEDFSQASCVYDMVFDTVGKSGFWRNLRSLKRGGSYILVAGLGRKWFVANLAGGELGKMWAAVTKAVWVVTVPGAWELGDLMLLRRLIEEKKLRTVIEKSYPLAQIGEAHRHAEGGHKKGHLLVLL